MKEVQYQGILLLRARRLPELVRCAAVRGAVDKRVTDCPDNDTFVPEGLVVLRGHLPLIEPVELAHVIAAVAQLSAEPAAITWSRVDPVESVRDHRRSLPRLPSYPPNQLR